MSNQDIAYFAPGPAKLPHAVLAKAQKEIIHYKDTGVSPMELSHRAADFTEIMNTACSNARKILNIPNDYKVGFVHGGGTGQFAAVPLNFIKQNSAGADYCVTGTWSSKAIAEAAKYGKVHKVFSLDRFTDVPAESAWAKRSDASYLYYTDNETVHGVEYPFIPTPLPGVPLVCDMSSNIMTREFDVSKYSFIYAAVQKNIGPAGATLVIMKDDMAGNALDICPTIFNYTTMLKNNSCYNTPPCYNIYMTNLVFEWILEQGGLIAMEKSMATKSKLLYDVIDSSNGFYYNNNINPKCRSRNNVVFRLRNDDEELEAKFVKEAKLQGLYSLKGHRSVGGMRASLYNAISVNDAERLASFMKAFASANQ